MTYRIIVAPKATRESLAILKGLQEKSTQGAGDWYLAYRHAVSKLMERPERWGVAAESPRKGRVLRQAFFRTKHGRRYRLIFCIDSERVVVLRVRAPGQRSI